MGALAAGSDGRGGVNTRQRLQGRAMRAGYNTTGAAHPGQQRQHRSNGAAAPPANPVDSARPISRAVQSWHGDHAGRQRAQSAPAGQQPNVLDAFLANNPGPQAPGAGGYSNAPFFNTLRGLASGSHAMSIGDLLVQGMQGLQGPNPRPNPMPNPGPQTGPGGASPGPGAPALPPGPSLPPAQAYGPDPSTAASIQALMQMHEQDRRANGIDRGLAGMARRSGRSKPATRS